MGFKSLLYTWKSAKVDHFHCAKRSTFVVTRAAPIANAILALVRAASLLLWFCRLEYWFLWCGCSVLRMSSLQTPRCSILASSVVYSQSPTHHLSVFHVCSCPFSFWCIKPLVLCITSVSWCSKWASAHCTNKQFKRDSPRLAFLVWVKFSDYGVQIECCGRVAHPLIGRYVLEGLWD